MEDGREGGCEGGFMVGREGGWPGERMTGSLLIF
jgi:hypothetical protein